MLTEKCPFCGSYNDVTAAECYFCHKDPPDTPGHKKKRSPKKNEKQSISLPPSMVTGVKKSPPGCLFIFCAFFFLLCIVVIFQYINNTYKLIQYEIPIPATDMGAFTAYYLQQAIKYINGLWEYRAIAISSIGMVLIFCYGLLNIK